MQPRKKDWINIIKVFKPVNHHLPSPEITHQNIFSVLLL